MFGILITGARAAPEVKYLTALTMLTVFALADWSWEAAAQPIVFLVIDTIMIGILTVRKWIPTLWRRMQA